MLLDDDVVRDGEPKSGTITSRLSREKWIEHLLFHLSRNTGSIVTDPNFNAVAEVPGCGDKDRLVVASLGLLSLARRVEAVRNQVENRPTYLSRKQVNLADIRIK
jgi:hypothetical protein